MAKITLSHRQLIQETFIILKIKFEQDDSIRNKLIHEGLTQKPLGSLRFLYRTLISTGQKFK